MQAEGGECVSNRPTTTLAQLKPGQEGTVLAVTGQGPLRRRLLEMGLTPGVRIRVQKKAPLGDPLELLLRGYVLSLRREEARSIIISREGRP